jgi:hypothetical protein
MVWLLPLKQLLDHFVVFRILFMALAIFIVFLVVIVSGASRAFPLTGRRWPHAVSHWYSLIVLFSPVLVVSLVAQARFHPLTHGYDLSALPNVQNACRLEANAECVEAVSRLSGLPREQIRQDAIETALELSFVVPDELIPHWSGFLLLLLCMAYARQGIELTAVGILSERAAIGVLMLLQVFYPFILGAFYLYIAHSNDLPDKRSSWPILTAITVLISLILSHVTFSSHQRRGIALTWYWTAVLLGLPALVLWVPLLLSSPEQRMFHQALLLGGFLLLTPWLQRQHDRVRALPV